MNRGNLNQEEDREGGSTVRKTKRRNSKARTQVQREENSEHATEDVLQGFASPDGTGLHAMGADSLSKFAEVECENGKCFGLGENSEMTETELAEATARGTEFPWKTLELYGDQLEKERYDGEGKKMGNYTNCHQQNKSTLQQQRSQIGQVGVKSTQISSRTDQWVHPMNKLNQDHVESVSLGQATTGKKLTNMALIADRAIRELLKSTESDHKGDATDQARLDLGARESNRKGSDQKLAEAGSNPTFNVGVAKPDPLKKGVGPVKQKKGGDSTRINKVRKYKTDHCREGQLISEKMTSSAPMSAPMTTRAATSNRRDKKLGRSKTTTTQLSSQIGKRKRSPGSPTNGLLRKKHHDTVSEKAEDDERRRGEIVVEKSDNSQIRSTTQLDGNGDVIGVLHYGRDQTKVDEIAVTEFPTTEIAPTVNARGQKSVKEK